jgi:hypothetical protein
LCADSFSSEEDLDPHNCVLDTVQGISICILLEFLKRDKGEIDENDKLQASLVAFGVERDRILAELVELKSTAYEETSAAYAVKKISDDKCDNLSKRIGLHKLKAKESVSAMRADNGILETDFNLYKQRSEKMKKVLHALKSKLMEAELTKKEQEIDTLNSRVEVMVYELTEEANKANLELKRCRDYHNLALKRETAGFQKDIDEFGRRKEIVCVYTYLRRNFK